MMKLTDALALVEQAAVRPEPERILLDRAVGRILAEDVTSEIYMPPFDKAAMDGYAIDSTDSSSEFRVSGVAAAGDPPGAALGPGDAMRIMTGAPVPRGADQVVVREAAEEAEGRVRFTSREGSRNICMKGEDVRPGDRVLKKGDRLDPAGVATAAAMGRDRLAVFRIPRVALVTTGSEIVPPGAPLPPGGIYDSNSAGLTAQLRCLGVNPGTVRRVPDDRALIESCLEEVLGAADLVLLSGGVSKGDFDYVPGVLESLGVDLRFSSVAMKPGRPTVFGGREGTWVFGLPGNPVSTYVVFEIMIRPFLLRMMGHQWRVRSVGVPLSADWRRRNVRRTEFLPVRLEEGRAVIPEYHGSAHIFALPGADGLVEIPAGVGEVRAGEVVHVRLLGS